ncbi:FAD-dependent oxidoreductase [Cohnella sp. GCM10027633]|uniref:FAD-dependent oxidoreductase n=1 Tax=unclassified Cohnella TaxID=2636738 RepID=UPI0036260B20
MRTEEVRKDITVVGGGLAGVCAAVAAARLGRTVALVQNRPVLGGNASSEVRVWVCGATGHGTQRYARESGIMGEMFIENQYRNPEGNPYYWDLVVLETVKAEPNIELFLNTDVHEVEADGEPHDRKIRSATGWMMGSERRIRFVSETYLDCTGDGLVGFLAGAEYRIGREAKHEYGEDWAPEVADDITLGSTLLFYTKDVGHPVKYVPPSFAKDITTTSIPIKRVIRSGDSGCHYWWIEWGGELDIVHENERIRDELWSVIYGIWDYIKNSGNFDAANMTLEWVGNVPGKREYRRFVGDYTLNQNDILAQRPFDDRVAFGGWSIDLHPPQGVYSSESGSKHLYSDGIYHIPYRSLYSRNVSNMLMAGRNISASHVAFGTTRVMATCAVIGEAAGAAAALCVEHGLTPRELYEQRLVELQQTMLKSDASLTGLANNDAADHARRATVEASSNMRRIRAESADEKLSLEGDIAFVLPVDSLEGFELLVEAEKPATLRVECWDTGRAENYVPATLQAQVEIALEPGRGWTSCDLNWKPDRRQNAFIIVRGNPDVSLHWSHTPVTGVAAFFSIGEARAAQIMEEQNRDQPIVKWSLKPFVRKIPCIRTAAPTEAYAPERIIDGYARPYGGPHMWVSDPDSALSEQWIELSWDGEVSCEEIHLTFNDDVNEDLINLHHHRTAFEVMPELAKDYRLEAWTGDEWVTLHEERNNRKRKRTHRLGRTVDLSKLRLTVEATNGCPRTEVVEVRVYG